MEFTCQHCLKTFHTFQEKANHIRWHHLDNSEYIKKVKVSSVLANEKRFGNWVHENVQCSRETCDNTLTIKYRENKKPTKSFCSRSCANSRGKRNQEFKELVSQKIKEKWNEGVYDHIDMGLRNKKFSSKGEREIVTYFRENFPDDNWKSGGNIKFEEHRFSRDLYSDKLKVCLEYDGIWHFKDIHNQLSKKQLKDLLLEKWCIKNGYRLIRIEEGFMPSFKDIEKLVYETALQIIKIGNSYAS